MKKIVLAAVFSATATATLAGGLDEPIIETPVVVEEQTSSSAGGILVPLLFLVLAAATAST